MDDLTKKRFLWGVVLAWVPWIPTLVGLASAFIGIANTKATGVTAVWGGFAELFVTWGIGTMLIAQVAAIVFLVRAVDREHVMRSLFAVLSICVSGLMLMIVGLFLWFSWFQRHNTF